MGPAAAHVKVMRMLVLSACPLLWQLLAERKTLARNKLKMTSSRTSARPMVVKSLRRIAQCPTGKRSL